MYTTCKFDFRDLEFWYYDPDGLARWGVLADVLSKDSRNIDVIRFVKPHGGGTCSHIHCYEPEMGAIVMKVANKDVDKRDVDFWNIDRPNREFSVVLLMSNEMATCLYVEQNQYAFHDVKDLINIIVTGLNEKLRKHDLAIKIQSYVNDQTDDFVSICAAQYVGKQLNRALHLMDYAQSKVISHTKTITSLPSNKGLKAAVVDYKKAEAVVNMISELMYGKCTPMDLMMPTTAAIAAGQMREPKWKEYHNTYPDVDISEKSFYRLRKINNKSYQYSEAFRKMVADFRKL